MITAIRRLLTRGGWEAKVPLSWLLHTPGAMNARFAREARVKTEPAGEGLQIVRVNDEPYVWPVEAPLDDLLAVICELAEAKHPHQYFWGQTQIKPGDVTLDIGSCEGSFAAIAAAKGAEVLAIEPSPRMQKIIEKLFEVRGLKSPRILGCALGGTSGSAALVEEADHPAYARLEAGSTGSGSVPVLSLDDLVEKENLPRVDYIKCDAEGMDVEIIKGGEKTLRRFRPRLVICTYHADDHFTQLCDFLSPLGYHVQGKGFLRSGGKFRVMMLHAW